jgi:hypothetical protein
MELTKRLRYLTTDCVNASTAEALAAHYGLALELVEPRDLPRLERERADLVVDWDGIPEDDRARLLNGTAVNLVAVHGYNLGDGLAGFLPRRGILCGRQLGHHLFRALAGPAGAA